MPTSDNFLTPKGDYKNLIAFQKSECIYDITLYFIEHYLPKIGDRTVDQMKQAARSGKQNIAEGNETGTTSMEACIKLVNVALVLIHQTDFLLRRLLEKYKQEFLENGGIKEQMSQARRSWREEHGMGYLNGNYRKNGSNEDKFRNK
jgi:four helix bundle suffix protein